MARVDVSDYLDLKQMPPGRHVFALTSMRDVAIAKLGAGAPIVPVIDDAVTVGRETLRIELAWEGVKKTSNDKSRGGAHPVKQRIARALSNLYAIVQGRADGDDEVAVKARELLSDVFPNGVAGISNQTFEVMLGTIETIQREKFEKDLADHVKKVGVEREVRLLAELTVLFRQELQPKRRGEVTHDSVEKAEDALHEATSEVLNEVLHATSKRNFVPPPGSEPMTDVDRVRLREEILAPLNYQQELVTEAYARHKKPLDVNPNTGVELDPDANDDADDDARDGAEDSGDPKPTGS